MTHTPKPWKAVSNESYWVIVPETRGKNDPYQIGDVCSSYPTDKDQGLQQANAAHIVKCVNLHDELVGLIVKAREDFKSEYINRYGSTPYDTPYCEALKKAGAL